MAEEIISYSEVRKELVSLYGNCSWEKQYSDEEGNNRGIFMFDEPQILAFFNGKSTVAPLNLQWMRGAEIVETVKIEERKTVEKNTPYLGNAIVGAILGMFVYSSKKKVTTERIKKTTYWLKIKLEGGPAPESVISFGYDKQLAEQILSLVEAQVHMNVSPATTQSDKLVKIKYEDYPASFWVNVPEKYMNAVFTSIEGGFIPASVLDKAKEEQMKAIERDRKIEETAALNNQGIDYEKSGEIEKAIEVYEKNVAAKSDGRHSYDRLLVIYHKQKREKDEIRICRAAVKKFPNDEKYQVRLAKIEGSTPQPELPTQSVTFKPTKIWGELYFEELKKLREFDFYQKGHDNQEYYKNYVSNNNTAAIRNIVNHFLSLRDNAESAENSGNLATAAAIYEQMIAEKCYFSKPYDRLIKIYSKAKLKDDESRVLMRGIETLQAFKDVQLSYIRSLAAKYGATDFCERYISDNKSISYFMWGGGYTIYDPYNIIEKWKDRLQKIKNK